MKRSFPGWIAKRLSDPPDAGWWQPPQAIGSWLESCSSQKSAFPRRRLGSVILFSSGTGGGASCARVVVLDTASNDETATTVTTKRTAAPIHRVRRRAGHGRGFRAGGASARPLPAA